MMMMKYSNLLALLAAMATTTPASPFVLSPPHASSASRLEATVEKTELVPPQSTADLRKQGSTSQSYDEHVQKTYG